MPKMKTKRSTAKRFKVTGSGKIVRHHAYHSHILTHKTYKRGSRTLWLVITIVFMNYVGPILYFLLGREDE